MADRISPQWVIKEVTYFDHATHRFMAGDIEIAGERIVGIQAPGVSPYECAVDARTFVCTPGLVKAQTDSHALANESERLLRAGITTAGTLCASASECIVAASRARLHVTTRLLLNPLARTRSGQRRPQAHPLAPELRALEKIAALVRGLGAHLALAVHCPSIVSAYELVYAQQVAAALLCELGFVLADDEPSARAFRDRFYGSETQLLDFMQLLGPGTVVWGRSQLTRSDVEILAKAGARVIGLDAGSLSDRRAQCGRHATADIASAPNRTRFAALTGMLDPHGDADRLVDAATVIAAAALGERTCGRIAPGMRADLCLFSSPGRNLIGSGSEALIELFERDKPDAVVVAGAPKPALAAGGWAASAPAPAPASARACIPRAREPSSIKTASL